MFKLCSGTHRLIYNRSIAEINKRYFNTLNKFRNSKTCIKCDNPKHENNFHCVKHIKDPVEWNLGINDKGPFREVVMRPNKRLTETELWQKAVPLHTRQAAVADAVKALRSSIALQAVTGKSFKLKYKKRNSTQTFWVCGRALNVKTRNGVRSLHIFPNSLKKDSALVINEKSSKNGQCILDDIEFRDTRIINDRGIWYLLYTYKRDTTITEDDKPKNDIISLDPGVRTFMTGYSSNGTVLKFGENQIEQIKKLHTKIDTLKSARTRIIDGYVFRKASKQTGSTRLELCRKNITNRLAKLEKKVYDVTSNLHNQVSACLTDRFSHILLPSFGTSEMVQGKIPPAIKRMMNSLSFYKFKEKLKMQCFRKNKKIQIVSEAYTTKTCGLCGTLNEVGSSKVYNCRCGYTLDRDIHGSRNILVRFLTSG